MWQSPSMQVLSLSPPRPPRRVHQKTLAPCTRCEHLWDDDWSERLATVSKRIGVSPSIGRCCALPNLAPERRQSRLSAPTDRMLGYSDIGRARVSASPQSRTT